jgi:hypothetical protein
MVFTRRQTNGRRIGMKKKLAILAATAAMTMAVAGPASADDFDLDRDELFFRGYPVYGSVVDDVDYKNVREGSRLDGECVADDVGFDGFVAEWEITC